MLGSILSEVQGKINDDDKTALSKAVPELSTWITTARAKAELVESAAEATPGLVQMAGKCGIPEDKALLAIPVVVKWLKERCGEEWTKQVFRSWWVRAEKSSEPERPCHSSLDCIHSVHDQ